MACQIMTPGAPSPKSTTVKTGKKKIKSGEGSKSQLQCNLCDFHGPSASALMQHMVSAHRVCVHCSVGATEKCVRDAAEKKESATKEQPKKKK